MQSFFSLTYNQKFTCNPLCQPPPPSLCLSGSLLPANKVCECYVFTHVCHSVHRGRCGIPACLAAGLGGWYPRLPCRFPGPHPGGKLRGSGRGGLQAHTQGKLRGIWPVGVSRPTPKGGVEGDLARGVSRPTPGGSIPACTEADNPPMATAAGGTHPTAMHSCFVVNFKWASTFYQVRSFHKTECKVENQS